MIRPADNNPTLLLLLSEVRKNGEDINAVNGRLTSDEDCTRQNVSRLNKVEELILMTVGPLRELLVPNEEVTELQVCREQAEFDLDQKLDAFIDSMIEDDGTLKNIRLACMDNDNYAARFKSYASHVGWMLCTRPPTRKIKVADEDVYLEHGKMRKVFSTFVANVFAAAGERFVLTKEHASQKTSCGSKYSALVVETVGKKIFERLFSNRTDLQYWKISWCYDEDGGGNEEEEEESDVEPDFKRKRRHHVAGEEEEIQLRSSVVPSTLCVT
eukprot:scaffold6538_cov166-Ochromonas_danica.AAC.2